MEKLKCPECGSEDLFEEELNLFGQWFTCRNCKYQFKFTETKKEKLDDEEIYCTVSESLEQSLKEMQLMRQGKIPKKTINEVLEEIENE